MNFQLTGPNVSLQEDMGGGEETAAGDYVTFLPSSQYRFHDANNASSLLFFLQTAGSGGTVGGTGAGIPGSNSTSSGSSTSNATVVGTKSGSSSSSGATAKALYRGTLTGTVGASGSVTLTANGKPVTTLRAGRYTIRVADRSPKGSFTIQGIRNDPLTITGLTFVGSRTVTLTLFAGQWLYYPTFVGKKTYSVVTK